MREIKAGSTSQSINVFIADSSSTTGAGKASLAYNTSGLTCYYSFTGANATSTVVTLVTLATVTTAYATAAGGAGGGFKEIDATNMTGWYRFDIPDAALATAKGPEVSIHFQGSTNVAAAPVKILLIGWDNQAAIPGALKKNTALSNFEFMMTDSTNHLPATGKTVTCTRSIDGGTFAAGTLANVAEVSNGMYRVDFLAADLNGNVITLRATAASSDDTFITMTTTS